MKPLDKILDLARQLPSGQLRKLLKELESLENTGTEKVKTGRRRIVENPYARTVKAGASLRSDFTDLSTDKYRHVAAAGVGDQ